MDPQTLTNVPLPAEVVECFAHVAPESDHFAGLWRVAKQIHPPTYCALEEELELKRALAEGDGYRAQVDQLTFPDGTLSIVRQDDEGAYWVHGVHFDTLRALELDWGVRADSTKAARPGKVSPWSPYHVEADHVQRSHNAACRRLLEGIDDSANCLHLVSCSGTKLDHAAPAKDLYQGDLFKKTRQLMELQGAPWLILSAEWGLVHPDQVLEPYERTLTKGVDKEQRKEWASRVALGPVLRQVTKTGGSVYFWAGERYRENLWGQVERAGRAAFAPLEGLGIGQQRSRLGTMIAKSRTRPGLDGPGIKGDMETRRASNE
jgi:hypothetical protein